MKRAVLLLCLTGCVATPGLTPEQVTGLPDTALCQRQLNLGNFLLRDRQYDDNIFDRPPTDAQVHERLAGNQAEIDRRHLDCRTLVQAVNHN